MSKKSVSGSSKGEGGSLDHRTDEPCRAPLRLRLDLACGREVLAGLITASLPTISPEEEKKWNG